MTTENPAAMEAEAADPTTPPERLYTIYNLVTVEPGLVDEDTQRRIYAAVARNPNTPRRLLFEAAEEGNMLDVLQNPALDLLLLTEALSDSELRSLGKGITDLMAPYVSRAYANAARRWHRKRLPAKELNRLWKRLEKGDAFDARAYLYMAAWQLKPGVEHGLRGLLEAWHGISEEAHNPPRRTLAVAAEDRFPYDAELARIRSWLR